jgi:hypothetical protein
VKINDLISAARERGASDIHLEPGLPATLRVSSGLLGGGPPASNDDIVASTLAALIQEINQSEARHIITLEYPIEFQFQPQLDTIPPALHDRLEVIALPGYTDHEKFEIARRYLVSRQLKENGLTQGQCRFKETDVHIHVPAGAVPKDGPSAGVAMFTALASLFSNTPARAGVAMTGEITLRGLIFA